ncbi:MAG TPA: Mur ligase family protein, partial [Caldilineaceae bacterium]|nr:Mur ligase family protein [Caldilineaceae bacterium]
MTTAPVEHGQTNHWQQRLSEADPLLRVHLLGIGGAGLSAIARVLHEQGITVSGSDRQPSKAASQLAELGIRIQIGQRGENLTNLPAAERPDVVLASSAVDKENPERQAAAALGIPVVKRDAFLPVWLAKRRLIAVAGSAGKSTTTAMIVKVLCDAGREIGYLIGAELPGYRNAAAGREALFVLEADEYDGMFLALRPNVAVVTNVIWDHPDCYPTPDSFWQAFSRFVARVPADGLVVAGVDDPGGAQLVAERQPDGPRWLTYGCQPLADLQARDPRMEHGEQVADVRWAGATTAQLRLTLAGLHNVQNALAA